MNAERIKIDFLRGVAALAVLFAHADAYYLIYHPAISGIKGQLGSFGVCLFFILSGALIWRSAKPLFAVHREGEYLVNRATRILPLYWVSLAACAFLVPTLGSHFPVNASPEVLARHLTFTHTLPPSVTREINPVLWTLAYEATFYNAVPVLLRWAHPSAWLAVTAAVMWFTGQGYWAYFSLFAVGMAFEEVRAARLGWLRIAGLLAGLVLVAAAWWFDGMRNVLFAAAVAGSLYMIPLPRWMRWPMIPIALTGVISYSLYIWHYVLLEMIGFRLAEFTKFFGDAWQIGIVRATIVIGLILAFSTLSYLLIERPFMGPIRVWLLKRRPVSPQLMTAVPSGS